MQHLVEQSYADPYLHDIYTVAGKCAVERTPKAERRKQTKAISSDQLYLFNFIYMKYTQEQIKSRGEDQGGLVYRCQ
jgi:hypothetical protein